MSTPLHPLVARVCAKCGFVELYVEKPDSLAKVLRERSKKA